MPVAPPSGLGRPGRSSHSRQARRLLLSQAGRFLLVGGVATVADVGLFNLLHYGLQVGPLTSKVASTVAGGTVAFLGNREWSFGDQESRSVRSQAPAFLAVNIAALLLALVPLAIARYLLGLTSVVALNLAANVLGLGLATVLRFEGYRRWVFRAAPPRAAAPPTQQQNQPGRARQADDVAA